MSRKAKLITAGVVILLFIAQIWLPLRFSRRLKSELADKVAADSLEVSVHSLPGFKLLGGRVDRLELESREAVIDGLEVARLEAAFKDLVVSKSDGWRAVEGRNSSLYLELKEAELNRYLAAQPELAVFEEFQLDLTPGQVMLTGVVNFLSARIRLQLEGKFEVAGPQEIIFTSQQLAVEEVVIPPQVIRQLEEKLQVRFDLADFPLPLAVKEVKVSRDRLEITGGEG